MRTIIILSSIWIFLGLMETSCRDVEVGYLITEYAGYGLDSMVIKYELDATPPVEAPNPVYEELLNDGWTPEDLADMRVYPTILVGGGEDYERVKYDMPWVGTAIEGIEGSAPIRCIIKSIVSDNGDAEKLAKCISVRGDGTISVPVKNDIPLGRYKISLNFTNEGWSKDVDDCFTIIVK